MPLSLILPHDWNSLKDGINKRPTGITQNIQCKKNQEQSEREIYPAHTHISFLRAQQENAYNP